MDDEEAEQGVWQRCIPHRRLSCGHAERDTAPRMEGCWQSGAGTAEGKGSFINLPYHPPCTCLFSLLIFAHPPSPTICLTSFFTIGLHVFFHPKVKHLSSFTHPHVTQKRFLYLSKNVCSYAIEVVFWVLQKSFQ